MMPAPIKVSAILPNFNDAELLPRAIRSLLNQSEPISELIIVDDGSTDNSLAVIESYMNEHHIIRLIQHDTNRGVCAALNTGIENATGDYVILCAADDWYAENMIAHAKKAIRQNPRVGLVCGDAIVSRFDMEADFKRTLPYSKKNAWINSVEFRAIAKTGYVGFNGGGGMLIKRQAILEAGMLYPELRWHCDWLLYFTIALRHGIYYVDHVFVHINMRKTSYSEGKQDKNVQNTVMLATIRLIQDRVPDLWSYFKSGGLLPHYSMRYIPLFISDPIARSYVTWRMIWKTIINNRLIVRIGRLFPYRVILQARKLLRA